MRNRWHCLNGELSMRRYSQFPYKFTLSCFIRRNLYDENDDKYSKGRRVNVVYIRLIYARHIGRDENQATKLVFRAVHPCMRVY